MDTHVLACEAAGEVAESVGLAVKCIECGDDLVAERAALGYEYCTNEQCQAMHHRGLTITAIGVNKSAEVFIVGDQEEIRRRIMCTPPRR